MASGRIDILDGWRAASILFVLAGHLLPMGPHGWGINSSLTVGGMALFFALSGFLITRFLLDRADVAEFLRRRLFRIVPLAWAAMLLLALANGAGAGTIAANLLFVANLPPPRLMPGGAHLWSLCVEAQFYICVALLVALGGRRALWLLPPLCIAVTIGRIAAGAEESIVTWLRIDDILAGGTMALLCGRPGAAAALRRLPQWLPLFLLVLVLVVAGQRAGWLNYLRSYVAAAAIGVSIFSAPDAMRRLFSSRPAVYVATISYALYIFHLMFDATWLGSGDRLVKYAKRPLLLAATFAAAHISTFHFERPLIALGKRLGRP
ncbi:acyltransferase family protein [Rhizorhabdus dicambivorans]|nr:acyltransferase [Rhizorhabdus dicambivorans]